MAEACGVDGGMLRDGWPAIFFVYVSAKAVPSACFSPCWKRGFAGTSGLWYHPTCRAAARSGN